ncbi:MOSC domain-containing protein [Pseudonocardia sp. HH130629-09]|uniref:MOSC domain-containing protein n=1 Tax=Pseudonocardia sp. HH130629-09 TaxID=1641402 RepID=UPI0006CB11EC|nr:MOSC domain-containing protein [Pseudonocardia sp. HH130629-09]ALE83816.1 sulfurase [Pseudonocardia sp. HH130629-09]
MSVVESVSTGVSSPILAEAGTSGIDELPVTGPVRVAVPAAASGLAGDTICDADHHGGPDQAVYAYAREDLEFFAAELGPLRAGTFGENLTTRGIDVSGAELGECWRVGGVVLQVTAPRVPCRTSAAHLERAGWVKRFTAAARPGAYLRVLSPGEISAGDTVTAEHRPGHGVTVADAFRALLGEPDRLPDLLAAGEHLLPQIRDTLTRRSAS